MASPCTLTQRKTKQEAFWTEPCICSRQINNPNSVFRTQFLFIYFFYHKQIEFGACSLVTIIFSVIISFLSVSSLLRSQLFLVLAAIRDLMTPANLALSCFMVIALKQPSHFRKSVNELLYFLFPRCCLEPLRYIEPLVEALQ